MRIKNKYLRNRHAKIKAWKKAKKIAGGEFTQKYFCQYTLIWYTSDKNFPKEKIIWHSMDVEKQMESHKKWIDSMAKGFLNGNHKGIRHAPKWYKKTIERSERRQVKKVIDKMTKNYNNVDSYTVPNFKHNADWDWF